ncbi:hypothetical protein AX16_009944 [Volvariella volvacea WC 439]|nr:hypothetical protein AX16_009944 [Volvariella volvacea WC 439]
MFLKTLFFLFFLTRGILALLALPNLHTASPTAPDFSASPPSPSSQITPAVTLPIITSPAPTPEITSSPPPNLALPDSRLSLTPSKVDDDDELPVVEHPMPFFVSIPAVTQTHAVPPQDTPLRRIKLPCYSCDLYLFTGTQSVPADSGTLPLPTRSPMPNYPANDFPSFAWN